MHPHVHEPISPELVLVDPELAARVRPVAVAGRTLSPHTPSARPTYPRSRRLRGHRQSRSRLPPSPPHRSRRLP